jgi:hypothetical protein
VLLSLPVFLSLAGALRAEEAKPPPIPPQELGVFRMVFHNGADQTVAYFLKGASPRVEALLHEVERVENEMIFRQKYAAQANRDGAPAERAA